MEKREVGIMRGVVGGIVFCYSSSCLDSISRGIQVQSDSSLGRIGGINSSAAGMYMTSHLYAGKISNGLVRQTRYQLGALIFCQGHSTPFTPSA